MDEGAARGFADGGAGDRTASGSLAKGDGGAPTSFASATIPLPPLPPNTNLFFPPYPARDAASRGSVSKIDPLAPHQLAPQPPATTAAPVGTSWPGLGSLGGASVSNGLQIGALNSLNASPQQPQAVASAPPAAPQPQAQTGAGVQQLLGIQPSVMGYLQYQAAYQQLLSLQMMAAQQQQQQPQQQQNAHDSTQPPPDAAVRWDVQPSSSHAHGADPNASAASQHLLGFGGPHGLMQMHGGSQPPHLSFDGRTIEASAQVGMPFQIGGALSNASMPTVQGGGVPQNPHDLLLAGAALPGMGMAGMGLAPQQHSELARASGLASGMGEIGAVGGHKSNVELVFPRRGRKSGSDGDRRTHEPIQITMETMMGLFHLPLVQAASSLGLSPTAIKSVCRRLGIRKWPFRSLSAKSKWRNRRRGDKADEGSGAATEPRAAIGGPGAPGEGGDASSDEEGEEEAKAGAQVPSGLSLLSAAAEEELQAPPKHKPESAGH